MENKTKTKSNFSFKRLIYNDKYLIIISLLLAIVIWIIASINIGTDEVKTIKIDAPITLGDEVSDQLGMNYYSLHESIELSVTISGPKYVVGQVTANDLGVTFDTSSVNRTGVQNIPILVKNKSRTLDFDVTSTYPSTIEAFYDVSETKTFDLNLEYDENKVADGYTFGTPVMSEDKVQISGPKTYVDKIKRAVVNVDFDGNNLTQLYKNDCPIQIDGYGIETNYLSITPKDDSENKISSVSVSIPVLKKMTLPVVVNIDDEPFDIGSGVIISYSNTQLDVGVLDSANITQAVIGNISYNQLKLGRNEFSFDVTNLHGITVLEDVKNIDVTVTVTGRYHMINVPISTSDVLIEGVPEGRKAKIKSIDSTSLSIIVGDSANITSSDLQIKCDVSDESEDGKYPIQAIVVTNNNSWVYGTYYANIELTK